MHRALALEDILDGVCAQLQQQEAGRTLASLAVACTYFLLPALRALWRDALGVRQYEALMPPWAREHLKLRTLPASPPPGAEPSDWARFHFYAALVRTLNADPQTRRYAFRLPNTHILRVLTLSGRTPVFPRLESFNMFIEDNRGLACLPSFLSGELTRLELHTGHQVTLGAYCTLLAQLGKLAPALRTFKVTGPLFTEPELQHALLSAVGSLPTLRTLALEGVPMPQFFALLAPTAVRALTLDLSWFYLPNVEDTPSLHPCTLPNLNTLRFTCPSAAYALRVFSSISLPTLEHLSFKLSQQQTPVTEFSHLLELLARAPRMRTLRLTLSALNLSHQPAEAYLALCALRELEELELALPEKGSPLPFDGLALGDVQLARLTSAWRRLRRLRVAPRHGGSPEHRPRLTLRGVAALAEACAELEEVEVHVDLSQIPGTPEAADGAAQPRTCMRRLRLGKESVLDEDSAEEVSEVLRAMWPAAQLEADEGRLTAGLVRFCKVHNARR